MKKLFPRLGAIVAAVMAFSAQATEFRSSDVHPDDYPTVQAVRHMGELISQRTNGKHSVKVFSKSVLGSEKDTIEQTKLGALAMTRVNVAPSTLAPEKMMATVHPSSDGASRRRAARPTAPAGSTSVCVAERARRIPSAISASLTVTKSASPLTSASNVRS